MRACFPMASDGMRPVARFPVGERWLSLYDLQGPVRSAPYSLYYDDEPHAVQHNMTAEEAFRVLSQELNKR